MTTLTLTISNHTVVITGDNLTVAVGERDYSPERATEIPAGSHGQCHELVAGPVDRQGKPPVTADAVASTSELIPHSSAVAVPTNTPDAVNPKPPAPAASGEPIQPDPHTPLGATAVQEHQIPQLPAQNDDVPHVVGQGDHEPVNHYGHAEQEDASAAQTGNEVGSVSGATVTNFTAMSKADQIRLLRPHCQHPDDLEKCGGSGRNHCHVCKKAMAESEAA